MIASYSLVFATILLTAFGQIVIKSQVLQAGATPDVAREKAAFFLQLLLNPWIISGLIAAFLASITWMAAMKRLPLSQGYPSTSLSFMLILVLANLFFGESITPLKVSGIFLIVCGGPLVGVGNT